MKNFFRNISTVLFFFCLTSIQAGAIESTAMYLYITGLESAGPPVVVDNYCLFTYQTEKPVSYVAIRFAHEDYTTLHVFEYTDNKIFFLLYPLPDRLLHLKYRMVIDGVWMADPMNPRQEFDILGIPHSLFELPFVRTEDKRSPVVKGRNVSFYFRYDSGRVVSLAGDFNAFDPYLYRLQEYSLGDYSITLQLPPGEYGYYFVVDGYQYPDPLNPRRKLDSYSRNISIFQIN